MIERRPKEIRKDLWDYLKAEGFEITPRQHERIKEILEEYIIVSSEIRKDSYNSAMGELEIARKGFNEWRKARHVRNIEKGKRKRERRLERELTAKTGEETETAVVCVRTVGEQRSIRPYRKEPPKSFLRDV